MGRTAPRQRIPRERLGTAGRGWPGRAGPHRLGQLPRRKLRHFLPFLCERKARRDRAGHDERPVPGPRERGGRCRRDAVARLGRIRHQLGQGPWLSHHAAPGRAPASGAVHSGRQEKRLRLGGAESEARAVLRLSALSELREPAVGVRLQRHADDAVPPLDAPARAFHWRADDVGNVPDALRRRAVVASRAAGPQPGLDREAARPAGIRERPARGVDDRQSPVRRRRSAQRGDLRGGSGGGGRGARLLRDQLHRLRRAVRRGGSDPPVRGAERQDHPGLHDRDRRPEFEDLPWRHASPHRRFAGLQIRRLADRGLPVRARRGGLRLHRAHRPPARLRPGIHVVAGREAGRPLPRARHFRADVRLRTFAAVPQRPSEHHLRQAGHAHAANSRRGAPGRGARGEPLRLSAGKRRNLDAAQFRHRAGHRLVRQRPGRGTPDGDLPRLPRQLRVHGCSAGSLTSETPGAALGLQFERLLVGRVAQGIQDRRSGFLGPLVHAHVVRHDPGGRLHPRIDVRRAQGPARLWRDGQHRAGFPGRGSGRQALHHGRCHPVGSRAASPGQGGRNGPDQAVRHREERGDHLHQPSEQRGVRP